MQRFNQSPRSAARSRGTPIRSRTRSPRSPPRSSILDSPSSLSPPRRGILRQPNASPPRSILRQATISPPPLQRQSNRMPELSQNEQDDIQLDSLQSTIRDLIRENIGLDEADTAINNLQGHQDIKDMFSGVGSMEYVPRVRVLLDILDLIRTKQDALAQAMIEEAEENELAEAETDTGSEAESEAESESDSDDEPLRQPSGVTFDSDDEDAEDAEDFDDFLDRMARENAARENAREQPDDELGYDSDDLASLMDSDDDIANAGTVDVSATLRF